MTGPKSGWRRLAMRLWQRQQAVIRQGYDMLRLADRYFRAWRDEAQRANEAEQGARQIAQIMDATLCRVCLDYGQKMPNGGRRISMEPVSTSLLEEWAVSAFRGEDGEYQIMIKKREPPSG